MKLILAVPVPEPIQQTIIECYAKIRGDYPYFSWTSEPTYHITVKNLGEREKDTLPYIIEAISRSVYAIPPIYLTGQESRILVGKGITLYLEFLRSKQLENIRTNLSEYFSKREKGLEEQEYKPHITLAQYKLPSKQQYFHLKKKLKQTQPEIDFLTQEIVLYEAITTSTNPIYEKIHTFELVE